MTDELQGLARYIDAVSAPVELRDATDRPGRRRSRSRPAVAVAIAAATAVIAAVVAGVVAFGPRSHTGVPPASTPATLVAPVRPTSVPGPASAANREPVFLSTTEGWICDTPLRFTTDGGVTWQPIGVGTTKIVYNDPCAFVSGGHAWIALHGAAGHPIPSVVRVVTGPHPEVDPVLLNGAAPSESVWSLAFADALRGWAATIIPDHTSNPPSNLYRTTDGGIHWQRIASNTALFSSMRFTSATAGWGVAGRRMERTSDGGRTWRIVPIVPTPAPTTSYVGSLDKVFVFGDRIVVDGFLPTGNFGRSFIETSNDDGAHWSLQTISTNIIQPPGTAPWEFVAVDATHWRFGLGSAVVTTDNAGKTWQQRPMHLRTVLLEMTGISFVTPDIGWAVGCDTTCYTVAFTNDAGRSWRVVAPADRTTIPSTSETSSANGLVRCRTSNLSVVLRPAGSGAGNLNYEIVFRNDSESICEMTGYPGVSFLDASGVQIGVPAQRSGAVYSQISVAPRANAYAVLDVFDPDVRACPTATAHFVRVYPPDETRALLIKVDASNSSGTTNGIRVCAQQVPPASIDPIVAHPRY
jgi:photosystem II stability/assembly factor-like uncharacterized protein